MPPKKQQKKEIVSVFQPTAFWKYVEPTQQNIDKTQTFLTTFDKQLKELISEEKSMEQNYEILCQKMGIAIHPCLQKKIKQSSNFPQLKNKDYGDRFVQLMNHKIDIVSLKLFGFLIATYKMNSIKLSRNELDKQADELKKILQKQNSITTLFLEWNPLLNVETRKQIYLVTVKPSIQHLILRDNQFGDEIFQDIIRKIKSIPEICLKSLDFSGNKITKASSDTICNFIEEEKNLQYLGLAKNQLWSKFFLNKLFLSIGEIPLTEEDYVKHQQAVKIRDEVIQKNKKKKKGAVDEPVPFVLEVKQTEDGKFFVKNTSLEIISLAKNGIGDSSASIIKNFAQNQGKNVQLFLDGNKITRNQKQLLKQIPSLLI